MGGITRFMSWRVRGSIEVRTSQQLINGEPKVTLVYAKRVSVNWG